MLNILISSIIFVTIITVVFLLIFKYKKMSKYNAFIYVFLFSSWFMMFLFKESGNLNPNSILNQWWVWAIVLSLYQFTQALVRVPLGILSQKIKSRRNVVLLAMLIMLLGLTLVIASNFAVWSIIVASITAGVVGATFGLNSQYWSENWDIKKCFISAAFVFTIPVAASSLATVVTSSFIEANISLRLMAFVAVAVGTVSIIGFSFFKERTETILLDNVDPNAQEFVKGKGMKDVFALSLSAAVVIFAFTYVTEIANTFAKLEKWVMMLIKFVSLSASVVTAFIFVRKYDGVIMKNIGIGIISISAIVLSILFMTGAAGTISITILVTLVSFGFGIYFMTMFGTTLHFDHKFPVLVMAIFLSVKSFFTGAAILTSSAVMNTNGNSAMIIGGSLLGVMLIALALSEAIGYFSFKKNFKKNNINNLLLSSTNFERNSSKLVE